MKVSMGNLNTNYIESHLIKFYKTNLSVQEPHKMIDNHRKSTPIALLYDDEDKTEVLFLEEELEETLNLF